MNLAQKVIRTVDRFQQRLPGLSFVVAVVKKFDDDQAGNLAALVAYYAYASIFPLLLVLFTVLNIVVRNNAGLRERVLDYAVTDVGAFGTIIVQNIQGFHETGPALVIGVLLTLYGARRVAGAMQNALNSAWEVPRSERPRFPWNYLRSFALVLLVGLGEIGTSVLSSFISGGHLLPGFAVAVLATIATLIVNVGLFWLAFRLATSRVVSWRELRLGAIAGGCVWQALQLVGGFYIVHALAHSRSLYGQTFGVVLGLLAWLFVQAEATLWVIEANVVWVRRLWPRSLAPPPLTKEDVKAYELYAQADDREGETIKVDVTSLPGAGPEDEKMPGRAEGAPARSDLPPVSATTARGEEAHDSGEDR
jgi:membrane protein